LDSSVIIIIIIITMFITDTESISNTYTIQEKCLHTKYIKPANIVNVIGLITGFTKQYTQDMKMISAVRYDSFMTIPNMLSYFVSPNLFFILLTMGLSRTVSVIKGDYSRKSQFSPTCVFNAPAQEVSPLNLERL